MGELKDEMDAIDEILDLCASVDISEDLYNSMNSMWLHIFISIDK